MKIETLFLDAGGVLTFPNWDRVSDIFARHGIEVSAGALRAADPASRFAVDQAHHVVSTTDADRGSMYFRMVFAGAGIPDDAPIQPALAELWAYHTEHNLWEDVPPDVFPALKRLRRLGVTLAVASNANGALHRAFDRLGLTPHFHAICDSCVEGAEKPDPRFFEIVLQRSGGRPETTLHVGDLYHVDVVGAQRAGLRAALMDPHGFYRNYDVTRVRTLDEVADLIGG